MLNLGQKFIVGFLGETLDSSPWIVDGLQQEAAGGVLLFDRNMDRTVKNISSPEQLQKLTESLAGLVDTPLFIAVDQEGGKVCRLKTEDGFPALPDAKTLAQLDRDQRVQCVEATAQMLAGCGINLNFAPVVDLDLNPDNPIISKYGRSFGDDPRRVAACAAECIEAHHRHGVACCLKHFPGHGSARLDSHLGFVDITGCWQPQELEPYRQLIQAGYADGVMTAHLVHRGLDPGGQPATLSRPIISGLLRQELGFDGVIFSDDLQMRAIADGWSYRQAVQQAVLAGVDVLVVGNNLSFQPDAVRLGVEAIGELLDKGLIDEHDLRQSLARIARLKECLQGRRSWRPIDLHTA